MSVIKKLHKDGYLTLCQDFATNTHYEAICGSIAYGVNDTESSDMDIHSITIPPIEYIFPHLTGYIPGFSDKPQNFETFQQHHISAYDKQYDVAIYSIVKFFYLAADNNPNILDMLWVPENCITHIDRIGEHIRKNRKHFLHKGAYHRFRGYLYAQLKKLESSNRTELIDKFGYDTKHLYHCVRLSLECEQILEHHDMDFSINSEFLKEIRKGALTLEEAKDWIKRKEIHLDELYNKSSLRYAADKDFLKSVLLSCIELKYGSLDKIYHGLESEAVKKLKAIETILNT